jgi:hypothetical protein
MYDTLERASVLTSFLLVNGVKDVIGAEYPLFPVNFGDIYNVPQSGDAVIAEETVPSLNGFRLRNETIASPVLYRTLKGEGAENLKQIGGDIPLWVPGKGQLEVLENRALLWLEAKGSGNGVEWCDQSNPLPVDFETDGDTTIVIDGEGRLSVKPQDDSDKPAERKTTANLKKSIGKIHSVGLGSPAGREVPASRAVQVRSKRNPVVNGPA